MCVDKLDEVREAGTDGEESTPQKIMFDMVDEEFEGAMDDEKVWDSIPKEVRGEPWTRRIYQFNDEHDAKLFFNDEHPQVRRQSKMGLRREETRRTTYRKSNRTQVGTDQGSERPS
jgi:hypothetical protein